MRSLLANGCQSGTAMTEIALALAMAFFSIMILTMVSMGGEYEREIEVAPIDNDIKLSTPVSDDNGNNTLPASEMFLIIYYSNRFYDQNLSNIDPSTYSGVGVPVLALDPSISVTDALTIQKLLPYPNITVTTLDKKWLNRLNGM